MRKWGGKACFYVSITSAKEKVYFIAGRTHESKFITELEMGEGRPAVRKCPHCKTADIVKKSGNKNGRAWAFWGCSNYLYSCDYTEWLN